jgi:hypothetical protein
MENFNKILNNNITGDNIRGIIYLQTILGAGIGVIYYGHSYFLRTKHQNFEINVIGTINGAALGGIYGGVCGLFLPITSLVYLGRIVYGDKIEYI